MAITLTSLLGTNSISSDRITINNNFSSLVNATNLLIQIVNVSTGAIDNSTFGSAPTIRTVGLTATSIAATNVTISGNVVAGNVISNSGYIQCGEGSYFGFGTDPQFNIARVSKGGTSGLYILDVSGAIGDVNDGTVGYVRFPFYESSVVETVPSPDEGSIYYELDNHVMRMYIGQGATGSYVPAWQTLATQEWITQNFVHK